MWAGVELKCEFLLGLSSVCQGSHGRRGTDGGHRRGTPRKAAVRLGGCGACLLAVHTSLIDH